MEGHKMEEEAINGTQNNEGEAAPTQLDERENKSENEENPLEEREINRETEVAPALIAVHPWNKSIVVAVGSELRVFDLEKNLSHSTDLLHKDSIRAICFSKQGKIFVSAGDDKLVQIWSTETWNCLATLNSEKRVSAVAISKEEQFVCFADKFGVVWVVDLEDLHGNQAVSNKKAVPILSHYCSIITSLEFSLDDQFIVSADRDHKIRVTVFPKNPLSGAHEIQSFCLGHSEFVSCISFIHSADRSEGLLLSGGGDSMVCLWDVISGSLLSKCEVGTEVGLSKECHPAVTDLCGTPNGSLVAVALQGLQGISLLRCNLSARTLTFIKVVSITGETFIPTSLGTSSTAEALWMVSGVSNLPGVNTSSLARVRVISGFHTKTSESADDYERIVLEDHGVPGGQKLLEKLQGSISIENKVLSAAADAVGAAMSNLLIKKQYTEERREFRKKSRNDRKFKP